MAMMLCWVDIPVRDLERAVTFYGAVLGEPLGRQSIEGAEFATLPHMEEAVSGCLYLDPEAVTGAGPLIYLSVDGRLAEAAHAVEACGGEVIQPPQPIGPYGFRAIIRDTEGNRIALHSTTA